MFRVVITTLSDKDYIKYEDVISPEHACNSIIMHIACDTEYNDRQWNYDLEELKDGEWKSWEDKNYQCIGLKILDLMEGEDVN